MKKWLFQPFVYVAGEKALFLGFAAMVVTAVIGFFSNTHFNGAIDMHFGKTSPISVFFAEQLISWATIVVVFYIAGRIFSRSSIRIVDVAGTVALARWPLVFAAIIGFGIHIPNAPNPENLMAQVSALTIILGFGSLFFVVWMIALLYNAFMVSCNIKGGNAVASFIIGLLIAEVLSVFILSFVSKFLN